MARRASKLQRFTEECLSATPEELEMMLDVIKGIRGKRQAPKPKAQPKPKSKPAGANDGVTVVAS